MAILVDELQEYPEHMISETAKRRGHAKKNWCHMTSDTSEKELHEFAIKLGLKREWFQGDHYDLTTNKRQLAVNYGAEEVYGIQLLERIYTKKIN